MVKGKLFGSPPGKANAIKKEQNYRKISWHQFQCVGSSQIPSQDDLNGCHQYLSLYKFARTPEFRTELTIYNTENNKEEVKILDTKLILDECTSITQLPNGELFCYGTRNSGLTVIIDRNYEAKILPFGTFCFYSSVLFFDNNIYCFGGGNNWGKCLAQSRKFALKKKRWINLTSLPEADYHCHSVIFNKKIIISGYNSRNLWVYSSEIDSFSVIPYDFAFRKRKFLINVERLYLIEWEEDGFICESEDEYHWKPISKSSILSRDYYPKYWLYNKEKIYISTTCSYYQFDLTTKVVREIEKS